MQLILVVESRFGLVVDYKCFQLTHLVSRCSPGCLIVGVKWDQDDE